MGKVPETPSEVKFWDNRYRGQNSTNYSVLECVLENSIVKM
jgi:hypothetical protein